MIEIKNLRKQYGDFVAVDNLNLQVPAGQVFGFLGPNGAGKTTTIRTMMGILQPTAGQILLGGHDVITEAREAKSISGFIPDRPFIYEKLSGEEFLEFVGKLHGVNMPRLQQRIDALLQRFDLEPWRNELVESYSHGMKQRLVVCAALIHEPKVLVVDEPMVGMDPRGARKLKDLFTSLAESGVAVFLSTHSISVAEEICHRIGIIQRGRLVAYGTRAEIHAMVENPEGSLESVFLQLTHEQANGSLRDES